MELTLFTSPAQLTTQSHYNGPVRIIKTTCKRTMKDQMRPFLLSFLNRQTEERLIIK